MIPHTCAWVGFVVASLFLGQHRPPELTRIDPAPSCLRCGVVLTVIDTVGGVNDPASPANYAEVARATDGVTYVASTNFPGQILRYDRDGSLSGTRGQEGDGPGEFRAMPVLVSLRDKSLAALGRSIGRITVFSPSGELERVISLGFEAHAFAATPDGGFVVSGRMQAEGRVNGLHFVSGDGQLTTSFLELPSTTVSLEFLRYIAVSPSGAVWAAAVTGGRLEEWTSDGSLRRVFELAEPGLLQTPATGRIDFERNGPPTLVSNIAVSATGFLWVYLMVPDPNFRFARSDRAPPAWRIYDTRILVIDLQAGVVQASADFDNLVRPLGEDHAYELVELPDGDQRVRILSVAASHERN